MTVFLTAFGAYSATARPASAGTSMAMPRAWPSFSVATASLLTKVVSTAASSGTCGCDDVAQAVMNLAKPQRQRRLVVGFDGAGSNETQRIAKRLDDAPAGAPKAGIDADDANRLIHRGTLPFRRMRCQTNVNKAATDMRPDHAVRG